MTCWPSKGFSFLSTGLEKLTMTTTLSWAAPLLTVGGTALIAYLLPKLLARIKESSSNNEDKGTRQSRLLQQRFGSVLADDGTHDLQLESTTSDVQGKDVDNEAAGRMRADLIIQGNAKKANISQQEPNKKKAENPTIAATKPTRPPFRNTSDLHPGLDAFRYWWDVQTSLYRIYTVSRNGGIDPPPYNPSSRRGQISVDLRVTNETQHDLQVHWINYQGGYELKGSIAPSHTWTQSTWIDHPWVFSLTDVTVPIAHYIPYKIIPNVEPEASTVEASNDQRPIGIHRFSIVQSAPDQFCILDEILPLGLDIRSEQEALDLTLLHCVRTRYHHWPTLLQYLRKVQQCPDDPKYRQIRIANQTFSDNIWNTPARGVFFASGWVEHEGYVELGTSSSYGRSMGEVIATVEQWQKRAEHGLADVQPEGADGFGRAGYR